MMHKIKKATVRDRTADNAEFADYRNRLERLGAYLRASSAALNESEKSWKDVCNRQKIFAEAFANSYPDKDEVRDFGKQSAQCSQALVKEFVLKTEGSTAPHWQVDAVVQDYLTEICAIASEYKPIADAKTEVAMYTRKVDDLQNAKKQDESKISRNIEKLEEAKKAYEDILERVVEKMKAVYNKRQVALKATYVAYWSSQLRAFNLLDASLEPTRAFVEGSVESLSGVQIKNMTEEDIQKFLETNTTPTSTPKKTAVTAETKALPTSPVEDSTEAPAEPTATAI
ncbi:hypothetical protein BWQ96_02140 [Gracilariopsis chorda]|uniref:BAR domain-containing protein n=1 Tax=Gracilariopsis chorda TaxID=448386 RepID=A0A2V3J1D2_9FLOR|nr:hypothetical protein BWQ96_02140 [Gracilariopsis chorda]|eukprot:PXF48188.1 hypothetical protein BWQ96_02140 [Gracilariopsis chorda]